MAGSFWRSRSLQSTCRIVDYSELFICAFHIRFRSANLSQFIMHRGLLVSTMQAIFSSIFYFSAVPLFQVEFGKAEILIRRSVWVRTWNLGRLSVKWIERKDWRTYVSHLSIFFQSFLMVGYATIYTQLPVFSLVLDKDVTPKIAMDFPELYKELTKGLWEAVGDSWVVYPWYFGFISSTFFFLPLLSLFQVERWPSKHFSSGWSSPFSKGLSLCMELCFSLKMTWFTSSQSLSQVSWLWLLIVRITESNFRTYQFPPTRLFLKRKCPNLTRDWFTCT